MKLKGIDNPYDLLTVITPEIMKKYYRQLERRIREVMRAEKGGKSGR